MDLEEWEFLPDHRFLDFPEENEKRIVSEKRSVFNMDYFSSNPRKIPNQIVVVPVPIQFDPDVINFVPSTINEKMMIKASSTEPAVADQDQDQDQDAVSQVFFKKMKENEFVDMKIMDSPKSPRNMIDGNSSSSSTFEAAAAMEIKNCCSPRKMKEKEEIMDWEEEEGEEDNNNNNNINGGLSLWKWSLSGIGAICSFGVAAATICIIILGNQQKQKQNQKLRFQIYTDDKRIKQVVQQASKFNEAISAARGVPITRAHITFGGYYDAL